MFIVRQLIPDTAVNQDFYYFCIGSVVVAIFGLKPDLLIKDASFKVVLGLSAAAFLIGLCLHFTAGASHSAMGALLAPLPTLAYFRLLRRLFLKQVHREPIDTAFNWTPGLVKDRAFAFAFVFGAMVIILVAVVGAERLAKSGW